MAEGVRRQYGISDAEAADDRGEAHRETARLLDLGEKLVQLLLEEHVEYTHLEIDAERIEELIGTDGYRETNETLNKIAAAIRVAKEIQSREGQASHDYAEMVRRQLGNDSTAEALAASVEDS